MNESIFEKNDGEAIRKIEPKFYFFFNGRIFKYFIVLNYDNIRSEQLQNTRNKLWELEHNTNPFVQITLM